jgi:pyrophosphatase PpaX
VTAPPRPLAILFDLDGTLVDTVPFVLASVRHTFQEEAHGPTDAEWQAGMGTPLRDQLAQFAATPRDVERLFARYRAFWLEHHDEMTALFPGAAEVVRALRAAGHPLGIITAKLASGAERTLRHVGLWEAFDVVVGADTVARSKPDPLPVRHALGVLGRPAAEAVMVGDAAHDLVAGRAAGTATVGVLWGAVGREVLAPHADHLLADMSELLPLLRRLQAADLC